MRFFAAAIVAVFLLARPADACTALGDSIAVGVGAALGCRIDAKVGIGSQAFAVSHPDFARDDLVVISLGSNDGNTNPSRWMEIVRLRVAGKRVVWITPHVGAKEYALATAARHGDEVVEFQSGPDGIHPKSYQEPAARILAGGKQ